ncbi:MAG: type II toxin-antitoxin system Phd/YefM family antitoxin, partial [Chloroflexota bacterium]|nr:type II toxin-antitoxin system Phd/YefM family antitoxin [Chloroflexota bacterium]
MSVVRSESVSNFRNHYRDILARVKKEGPILLIQKSEVAAILVSTDEWNQLQRLKHINLLDEQSKLVQQGNYLT